MGLSPLASGALALVPILLVALARLAAGRLVRSRTSEPPSPARLGRPTKQPSDLERNVSRISHEISAMRQAQGDDHATLTRLATIVDLQGSLLERITHSLAPERTRSAHTAFPIMWLIDFVTGTVAGLVAAALYQWLSGT